MVGVCVRVQDGVGDALGVSIGVAVAEAGVRVSVGAGNVLPPPPHAAIRGANAPKSKNLQLRRFLGALTLSRRECRRGTFGRRRSLFTCLEWPLGPWRLCSTVAFMVSQSSVRQLGAPRPAGRWLAPKIVGPRSGPYCVGPPVQCPPNSARSSSSRKFFTRSRLAGLTLSSTARRRCWIARGRSPRIAYVWPSAAWMSPSCGLRL